MILAAYFLLFLGQIQMSPTEGDQESYSYEQQEEAPLLLSLNLFGGSNLQLSNGDMYLINPDHRIYSSLWITPSEVELGKSNDPKYPVRIINLGTGTAVNGRLMTLQKMKRLEQMQGPAEQNPGPLRAQPTQPQQPGPLPQPAQPQRPRIGPSAPQTPARPIIPPEPNRGPNRPSPYTQNTAQPAPQKVPQFIDTPTNQAAPSPEVQTPPPPPQITRPPQRTLPSTRTPIGPHQPPPNSPLPPSSQTGEQK